MSQVVTCGLRVYDLRANKSDDDPPVYPRTQCLGDYRQLSCVHEVNVYYLADLGQATSSVSESEPPKCIVKDVTCPRMEEVCTLALAQGVTTECRKSNPTTCNTNFQQTKRMD